MSRPFARLEAPARGPGSDDERARMLVATLREALDALPHLAPDLGRLGNQLAPLLAQRLTNIIGATDATLVPPMSQPQETTPDSSPKARVLEVLRSHEAGRDPGLTPEALARLTRLPVTVLGPLVSELVQAGQIVRDAWLVRLPNADDLLPNARLPGDAGQQRAMAHDPRREEDRRAPGDRRAIGDRRLYNRREHG